MFTPSDMSSAQVSSSQVDVTRAQDSPMPVVQQKKHPLNLLLFGRFGLRSKFVLPCFLPNERGFKTPSKLLGSHVPRKKMKVGSVAAWTPPNRLVLRSVLGENEREPIPCFCDQRSPKTRQCKTSQSEKEKKERVGHSSACSSTSRAWIFFCCSSSRC